MGTEETTIERGSATILSLSRGDHPEKKTGPHVRARLHMVPISLRDLSNPRQVEADMPWKDVMVGRLGECRACFFGGAVLVVVGG